jgi:hypothetical protein
MKLTILLMTLLLSNCQYLKMDFTDDKLIVENKSNIGIDALVNIYYPDTSIVNTQNYYLYPNEKGSIGLVNRHWNTVLEDNKIITIYFVSSEELKKYNFSNKDSLQILKKYSLSKDFLDSLNWKLVYP